MNTYEVIGYGLALGIAGTVPIITYNFFKSLGSVIKGRAAIELINLGDSPKNHRYIASDIRMETFGRMLMGRKKMSELESLTEPDIS